MYKSDRQRIEDGIIPFILEALMLSHIKQLPNRKDDFNVALELLNKDIEKEFHNAALTRRASRIEKKILEHWQDNDCEIRKAYMIMSYLAKALDEQEALEIGESTRKVVNDIDEIIAIGCSDENVLKQDISAAKQVPKVLRLLQEEGLF